MSDTTASMSSTGTLAAVPISIIDPISDHQCISNVVFGFVLVLAVIMAFLVGIGGTIWCGTRSHRRFKEDAERVQKERDELRDKEVKVHSSAVSHYQGEVNHWRNEFDRITREQDAFKRLLDQNGVNWQRASVLAAPAPSRPISPDTNRRDSRFQSMNFAASEKDS